MKHLKIFEEHKKMDKESALLSIFKSGIINYRTDLLDYAIEKGFDPKLYQNELLELIDYHLNYVALKYVNEKVYNKIVEETKTLGFHKQYEVTSLKGLSVLINLEHLDCSSTNLTTLEGIEGLINLERLDCSYNYGLTSLKGIENLIKLETIWADNTKLNSLEPIKDLKNLEYLECDSENLPEEIVEMKFQDNSDVAKIDNLIIFYKEEIKNVQKYYNEI